VSSQSDAVSDGALEADVCLVGAGPSGLSVATVLASAGIRVVLLEGGDATVAQTLDDIRHDGEDAYPQSHITETRASGLGGTSGIWSYRMSNVDNDPESGERGCRYAPMDPIDFEARPDVPHSGWPLTRADLDPWYARAQGLCGLGEYNYGPQRWSNDQAQPLPLDPDLVETQMFQFGPASAWSKKVVRTLRSQSGILILTDANVTRLETDYTGTQVTEVHFRRSTGVKGLVRARCTVLAAGGVESARLLLLSNQQVRTGLGNGTDQVGRYWMEHPLVRGGLLVAPPNVGLGALLRLYDAHWQGEAKVMAKLSVAPERMRSEGLLSTSALLLPREDVLAGSAVQAYNEVRSPSGRGSTFKHRVKLTAKIAFGAPALIAARRVISAQPGLDLSGWSTKPNASHFRVFEVVHQTEQSPDPDNRVTLSDETDGHGRRLPLLKWRWTSEDRRRITRSRDLYAEAFSKAGLGDFVQRDWENGQPRMLGGNHHHIGGTRMSTDPAQGVVDVNTKVFGMNNLFVTGSSVFPTGGSVNPTLTIVALGLRLGNHLLEVLQQMPDVGSWLT
jgi:choline dehydrogenase-like flavoprotein